jgi:hypothetical protein
MSNEISREDVTERLAPSVEVSCPECGATRDLWFNGGELDSWEHCGYRFSLETPRIDLVLSRPEAA